MNNSYLTIFEGIKIKDLKQFLIDYNISDETEIYFDTPTNAILIKDLLYNDQENILHIG